MTRRRWIASAVLLGFGLPGVACLSWGLLGPSGGPPRVESLSVELFRVRGDRTKKLGRLGNLSLDAAQLGDWARVTVEMNQPAYCYLIAFNPDGKDQLCYPAQTTVPPDRVRTLTSPQQANHYFPLTDGVGLQAFVLVASGRLLPDYDEWKAKAGPAPWQAAAAGSAWQYDGHEFALLDSVPRGHEIELPAPPAFERLCRYLEDRPGVEAVRALVFPVRRQVP
jgi:hypothetical protein